MIFRPEFFDIFGLITFTYLTMLSLYMLFKKKMPPKWSIIIVLIIGILGLIVDGVLVYNAYLS